MFIAFVNRPNGDFTFTGDRRRSAPATPRPISCSGCRRSSGGRRRTRRRTATAGCTPATRRTSSGRSRERHAERRAAIRAVAAVRRRERRAQLVPPRPAVDAVPRGAARPRVSGRRGRARAAPTRPTRTTSRRVSASCGIRPAAAARACARRGASSTTRSPGRATSSRTACSRRRSRRCSRSTRRRRRSRCATRWPPSAGAPPNFPPGLIFIGWGRLPDAVRAALQRHVAAADRPELRRRDRLRRDRAASTCRSSWRSIPASTPRDRRRPARGSSRRSRSCGRRSRSAQLLVRLAAGQPAHAADARHQLPRVLHARPRHRSRVGAEHRRRAAAGAAGHDRRRSVDRSRAALSRRATRSSTSATASSSASARSCRRRRAWPQVVRQIARRLAAERHRPGADRLPDRRSSIRRSDIRYLTNRPDETCDPNENAPHTVEQWFNTSCFVRRPLADTGTSPGDAGRNTVRGPGFARTDLSLFKNIDIRASAPHPAARRGVQPVQPDALRPARQPDRHAELRPDHQRRRRADYAAGGEVQFLKGSRFRVPGSRFWVSRFRVPVPTGFPGSRVQVRVPGSRELFARLS